MKEKPYPLPAGWESIQNTPMWRLMNPLFDIEDFKWNEFALSWQPIDGLRCVFWGNRGCTLTNAMTHYFNSRPIGRPLLMRLGQEIELEFNARYEEPCCSCFLWKRGRLKSQYSSIRSMRISGNGRGTTAHRLVSVWHYPPEPRVLVCSHGNRSPSPTYTSTSRSSSAPVGIVPISLASSMTMYTSATPYRR